jgi:TRAP-type mannitol/chloroaromatic compound transport system permease small subunit
VLLLQCGWLLYACLLVLLVLLQSRLENSKLAETLVQSSNSRCWPLHVMLVAVLLLLVAGGIAAA